MDLVEEEITVGPDPSYRSEVLNAMGVSQISEDLNQLALNFGFNTKDFLSEQIRDKQKILVLGSGNGSLVRDLRSSYPNKEVLDLNPKLAETEFRRNESRKHAVAAFNPELPFKDQSFDFIIDSMSSINYAKKDFQLIIKRVKEINRVLNKGGIALFGPIKDTETAWSVFEKLKEMGLDISKIDTVEKDAKDEYPIPHFVLRN